MQFELDRVVDEWHGPGARRGLLIEGHHVAGIEYRHYASWGFLSVAKGQEGKVDEILRRTAWRERLGLAGYQAATCAEEADVILLNTCCVRAKPEQKVRSRLGELRLLKQTRPQLIIGVSGCMAQKRGSRGNSQQ